MSKNHLSLCYILYWFHPYGVAVNIADDNVVYIYPTGDVWVFTCLICVHGLFYSICCYQYFLTFLMLVVGFVLIFFPDGFYCFGVANVLSFPSNVPFWCFFRFRGNFGDILGVYEWPSEIISLSNGFEPRVFFWKS